MIRIRIRICISTTTGFEYTYIDRCDSNEEEHAKMSSIIILRELLGASLGGWGPEDRV